MPDIQLRGISDTLDGVIRGSKQDSLTKLTFKQLLKRYEKFDSSLIIARVCTRDHTRNGLLAHSYYPAHALNKMLFRLCGSDIYSRYHPVQPRIIPDPKTRRDIVGEIAYYRVLPLSPILPRNPPPIALSDDSKVSGPIHYESPQMSTKKLEHVENLYDDVVVIDIEDEINGEEQKDTMFTHTNTQMADLSEESIPTTLVAPVKKQKHKKSKGSPKEKTRILRKAVYIGTDYHYTKSFALRQVFIQNSLEGDIDIPIIPMHKQRVLRTIEPSNHNIDQFITSLLPNFADYQSGPILWLRYQRSLLIGMALGFYMVLSCMLFCGTLGDILKQDGGVENTVVKYSKFLLPISAAFFDIITIKVFEAKDDCRYVFPFKLITWVVYVAASVFSMNEEPHRFTFQCTSLMICFLSFSHSIFFVRKHLQRNYVF